MATIGLIGAGLLGSAIAARLSAAGYSVLGYDLVPERRLGGASSAQQVVTECRTILFCLPTSDVVAQVVASLTIPPHTTLIDCTTGEPDAMAAIGASLAEFGIHYLDATIAGSSTQVRTGDVTVMLGGDAAATDSCEDLLRILAKRWFHLGPCGSGARMKLVVNLVLGLNRAVLAEGLSFASACGVDPSVALEVLQASPAFSRVMETKGLKMLQRDFEPQARLRQHLKDVRLILDEAAKHGAKTPLSELHRQLLESIEKAGFGEEDNAAILRAFLPV